ncbi:MAG: heat shock protein HspQ [Caulobacterales bacterium]|nr:heat shock protein HspQ [Caulobacterales bacterium]
MTQSLCAKFCLGQIVRHRDAAFRGVVMDVDASYAGDPAAPGPDKPAQPFYRVFVMGTEGGFVAYAAEEVLETDPDVTPLSATDQHRWFTVDAQGRHAPKSQPIH